MNIKRIGDKRPLWVSQLEVIDTRLKNDEDLVIIYRDIIEQKSGKKKININRKNANKSKLVSVPSNTRLI